MRYLLLFRIICTTFAVKFYKSEQKYEYIF